MSGVLIANKDETISISAPDIYGANFKISIFSQSLNTWLISNKVMEEYEDVVDAAETYVAIPKPKDDNNLEVNNSSLFFIGDIIKVQNYFYRIINKENNILFLHTTLKEDISENDLVTKRGNMSLYWVQVNISEPGDYIIRAKDSVFGLEITDSIKVVPKSIETMAKEIKTLEYAILGN